MIRNELVKFGRSLFCLTAISLAVLLGGCCSFCDMGNCCPEQQECEKCKEVDEGAQVDALVDCVCDKAVVFAFDIPTSQDDCGDTATYIADAAASAANDLKMHSGGAGVVDRSGGGGVVDRDGNVVTTFCLMNCEEPLAWRDDTTPWILLSTSGGMLFAETACY